jgi:hypothetical protein
MKFEVYSAQTGNYFMTVEAASVDSALDLFARRYGFRSCAEMWAAGRFEYITASVQS